MKMCRSSAVHAGDLELSSSAMVWQIKAATPEIKIDWRSFRPATLRSQSSTFRLTSRRRIASFRHEAPLVQRSPAVWHGCRRNGGAPGLEHRPVSLEIERTLDRRGGAACRG